MQPSANREDAEQSQSRGGARADHRDGPPIENRQLGEQKVFDEAADRPRLALDAGEALNDRNIAEHVGRTLGQRRIDPFDGALQFFRAADDESHQRSENADKSDQQQRQAPIDEERQWQQNGEGDEGRGFLAKESQPQPEHGHRSLEHDLEQATGVNFGVEAQRQMQDMLEIERHRREAAAMREAIGKKADEDGADDRKQRKADPGRDQREKFEKADIVLTGFAPRHRVDDSPEQDRFGKLRRRQNEAGEDEGCCNAAFLFEQAQRVNIGLDEPHRCDQLG